MIMASKLKKGVDHTGVSVVFSAMMEMDGF